MILDHSYGKEKEIRRLIARSCLHMDSLDVSAWMKYKYDPSGMFCAAEDKKIVACLQTKKRTFFYQGKACEALVLSLACTLPDYRQRGYFSELLEACMNYAACNHLITLAYTNFPKLLESKSFQPVSSTKYYWLEMENWNQGDAQHVQIYRPDIDLYPLYHEFLSHFDGSIRLDPQEFQDAIRHYLNCNHRMITAVDDQRELRGFAIYRINKEHIEIQILVYLDADAILDCFAYLKERCQTLSFIVSNQERFDKLFPMEIPRKQGTVLARLNNYKLFSVWSKENVHHAKEAFAALKKPIWNHMID